jgi:hypothetical protein
MPDTESTFAKLTYEKDGVVFLRPCLDVVCYWRGSAFPRRDGILDFYRQCIEMVGESLTFYQTETIGAPRKLRKDSLGLLEFWLSKTKSRRDVYVLQLESGVLSEEVSDRAISFQAIECGEEESSGFIRLMLPVHFFDEDSGAMVELAKRLFRQVEFNFGQAGYSLNWNEMGRFPEMATTAMGDIRKRYPGLDLADPGSSQYVERGSIKCINWLTMLGETAVKRLGKSNALQGRFGENIAIHPLGKGLMIQAGSAPEIGDANRRRTLPLYHQVGKVLAPLRDPEHPAFLTIDEEDDDDATNEWLARFDK